MPEFPVLAPFMPLSEPTFYIMLSLVPGEKHGYAILKDAKTLSGGKLTLSTSTLYTALNRLLDRKLIERLPDPHAGQAPHTGQARRSRKVYRLTLLGHKVLEEEVQRLQVMLSAASGIKK